MARTTIAQLYGDLYTALSSVIEGEYIFLGERPSISSDGTTMSSFAVIELPVSIAETAVGPQQLMRYTSGVIYLFTKSKKNNTLNVNAMSSLTESVLDLFPISGTHSVAAGPEVLGRGADGNGYQVVSITFNLHTK